MLVGSLWVVEEGFVVRDVVRGSARQTNALCCASGNPIYDTGGREAALEPAPAVSLGIQQVAYIQVAVVDGDEGAAGVAIIEERTRIADDGGVRGGSIRGFARSASTVN